MQLDFDKYKEWQFCDNKDYKCDGKFGAGNFKINSQIFRFINFSC